ADSLQARGFARRSNLAAGHLRRGQRRHATARPAGWRASSALRVLMTTFLWGLLGAAALVWPDRVNGPFDGAPLDRPLEALLIGFVVPILWWRAPGFLRQRIAQALILALLVWRVAAAALLVQDGWCVRFDPARPYVKDETGAPHAWDFRADWRSPN